MQPSCLRSPPRLTLRSRGLPPARPLARAPASVIIRRAGQAPSRRQPLSSNVRPLTHPNARGLPHSPRAKLAPAGLHTSALACPPQRHWSCDCRCHRRTRLNRLSARRLRTWCGGCSVALSLVPGSLVSLGAPNRAVPRHLGPRDCRLHGLPSRQLASRLRLSSAFASRVLGSACVCSRRTASASRSSPVGGLASQSGLTLRSSGLAPAWHLAREALTVIIHLAGQAPYRRSPLSSNVRHHKH